MCSTFLIQDVMDQMMLNGLVQDTVLLELSIMHCMPSYLRCMTDDYRCRTFLIRDVMDEMMLNGLVPDRVFLELAIMHCMRSSRIGDCFFYYNEMKRRGMQPSAKLQGLLISVLAREGHLQAAEEVNSPGFLLLTSTESIMQCMRFSSIEDLLYCCKPPAVEAL